MCGLDGVEVCSTSTRTPDPTDIALRDAAVVAEAGMTEVIGFKCESRWIWIWQRYALPSDGMEITMTSGCNR